VDRTGARPEVARGSSGVREQAGPRVRLAFWHACAGPAARARSDRCLDRSRTRLPRTSSWPLRRIASYISSSRSTRDDRSRHFTDRTDPGALRVLELLTDAPHIAGGRIRALPTVRRRTEHTRSIAYPAEIGFGRPKQELGPRPPRRDDLILDHVWWTAPGESLRSNWRNS